MTDDPEDTLSTLDALMRKLDDDPLGLTPDDLLTIVKHQRAARARSDAGLKAVKGADGPRIDLKAMGLVKPKAKIERRL
jgi:hypothetical protein